MHTDRLETLSKRFDEIEAALANPSGTFDQSRYAALMRERRVDLIEALGEDLETGSVQHGGKTKSEPRRDSLGSTKRR